MAVARRERGVGGAGVAQPVLAGVATAVIGFASAFTIVLSGLRAVGASAAQAASGLLVLCIATAIVTAILSLRTRMPISIGWSTPGAALLVSAGAVEGGYPAALGAFALAGGLTVAAGLWRRFGEWIAAIPGVLASALLAGVLLPVCLAPVRATAQRPELALPVIVAWALLSRFAPRWAIPGALAAAAAAIGLSGDLGAGAWADPLPPLVATAPAFEPATLVGLGVPLFLVTMASQNLAGLSVLGLHGYRPALRPIFIATGGATVLGAPFGAHGLNLAAITAALVAGPDAHPDPRRRWIAAVAAGTTVLVLGLAAGLITSLVAASPEIVVAAVAGLALLGALAAALAAALEEPARREAAVVTFVVSASGVTLLGISSPFWGLVAGLAVLGLQRGAARGQ